MLHIDRKPVQLEIDTGTNIFAISVLTYQAFPQHPMLKPSRALVQVECSFGKVSLQQIFPIKRTVYMSLKETVNNLLNCRSACQMGLVQRVEDNC